MNGERRLGRKQPRRNGLTRLGRDRPRGARAVHGRELADRRRSRQGFGLGDECRRRDDHAAERRHRGARGHDRRARARARHRLRRRLALGHRSGRQRRHPRSRSSRRRRRRRSTWAAARRRSPTATGRSGSPTTSAARCRRSIPRRTRCRGRCRSGASPNGIAVTPEAVWVSDEVEGTLVRVDPRTGTVVKRITLGGRPEGVTAADGSVWVGVQAAGDAHRGGNLRLQSPFLDYIDPAMAYFVGTWDLVSVTNDGLVGFKRVGGIDGNTLVPDLATQPAAPVRQRAHLLVPAAARHPLLERHGGHAGRRPSLLRAASSVRTGSRSRRRTRTASS